MGLKGCLEIPFCDLCMLQERFTLHNYLLGIFKSKALPY